MQTLQEQENQESPGRNPQLGNNRQKTQSHQIEGILEVETGEPRVSITCPEANLCLSFLVNIHAAEDS